MRSAKRFLSRPPAERRLLTEAVVWLVAVRLGLRVLSFRKLSQVLARMSRPGRSARRPDPVQRDQIVQAVTRANNHFPGMRTCLQEALVGQLLLARRGYQARLQIGVKRGGDGRLLAHAWLENGSEVLMGGPASHVKEYSVLGNVDKIGSD